MAEQLGGSRGRNDNMSSSKALGMTQRGKFWDRGFLQLKTQMLTERGAMDAIFQLLHQVHTLVS